MIARSDSERPKTVHVDTRQHAGKHTLKHGWLEGHGMNLDFVALPFGDYMRDGSNVSVDTKQGLDEVAQNLCRDHARFARECERAEAAGYRLVVLVEEGARYADRALIAQWRPAPCRRCKDVPMPCPLPRCRRYRAKPRQGEQVARIMDAMERRHGVVFEFCDRKDAGKRVAELLGLEV